jgi:hypothetical protein
MKVYEILIEAGQPRGYLGILYRMLPDSTQKLVAGELESALAWASKRLKGKPVDVASKDLADSWFATSQRTGIPLDDIIELGEKEARRAGLSARAIANAKAHTAALQRQVDDAVALANRPSATKKTLTALGSTADAVIKWGTVWGVAEPLYNCGTKIARAYELNKSGDPEWQGNKLHGAIQFYLDDCVAEIAAIFAAKPLKWAVFKAPQYLIPPAVRAAASKLPGGAKDVFQMFSLVPKTAEAAWIAWMGTPQGREWLARYLVSNAYLASTFDFVRNTAAGWLKRGYDQVADRLVDPSQQAPAPAEPAPYQGAKKLGLDSATGLPVR